ncbi:MAG: hypothetical protein ACRDSK_16615 [Actinophytocola sp.]|uniref:hypothetical protein n=1 Tax=Actinophytocola sp. TaxID=1872138 RepID=UPI003D6C00DE
MDLVAFWDWRAWTLAVLFVVLVGRLVWNYLAALAFRHLLLGGLLRRYGWQADLPGGDGGRAAFAEQERRRRGQAWTLLRQGRRGIREGYRTGVFAREHAGPWQGELTVTGAYRGRPFTATQIRRSERTNSGEGSTRSVRRRARLELQAALPRFEARTGLLTGRVRGAPPGLEALVRSRRFRVLRSDGGSLSTTLGPRLRGGRLLGGLAHLSAVADRLEERR